MYINRLITNKILEVQQYYPVTVITGPRQSGKSESDNPLSLQRNDI